MKLRNDITIQDVLAMAIAATLAVIHHGLVAPYAYELQLREMGL